MTDKKIDCYILPSSPLPMILPADCIAEVVVKPTIETLRQAAARWMKGYADWQNQRLPVMQYGALLNNDFDDKADGEVHLVVLNAIPGAARKVYTALLCHGDIAKVSIDDSIESIEIPEGIDKRYIDAVVKFDNKDFVVPKLSSLAIAFTYI